MNGITCESTLYSSIISFEKSIAYLVSVAMSGFSRVIPKVYTLIDNKVQISGYAATSLSVHEVAKGCLSNRVIFFSSLIDIEVACSPMQLLQ